MSKAASTPDPDTPLPNRVSPAWVNHDDRTLLRMLTIRLDQPPGSGHHLHGSSSMYPRSCSPGTSDKVAQNGFYIYGLSPIGGFFARRPTPIIGAAVESVFPPVNHPSLVG